MKWTQLTEQIFFKKKFIIAGNIFFKTTFHIIVVMELVYLVISRKMKIEKQSDCMLSVST